MTAAILVLASCADQGELKPLEPTSTPMPSFVITATEVTFGELQTDPEAYQNEVIRVSGSFQRLPVPDCFPNSGPGARWALVAENLRLDVVGYESLLHLVKEPAAFTLDGIFRLYDAPLGCGKEPGVGTAWYLEALTLIDPNPILFSRPFGEIQEMIGGAPALITRTPLPVMTATPGVTGTQVPTPTEEQTLTATMTATPPGSATPDLTTTPGIGTATPTATGTATIPSTRTVTPSPTSSTPTATGTLTPTSSPEPAESAVPLPTATTGEGGGGYPPPPDPYP